MNLAIEINIADDNSSESETASPDDMVEIVDNDTNLCDICNTSMEVAGDKYMCAKCGNMRENCTSDINDINGAISPALKISTGKNKGRYRHGINPSTGPQKAIVTQLQVNARQFEGKEMNKSVLERVAEQYNKIRAIKKEIYDENDVQIGTKKNVNRNDIKDEIIAGLIHYEHIRAGIFRKPADISAFMHLDGGFARGTTKLRHWQAKGLIDIPIGPEPPSIFAARYLEALGLEEGNYLQFIVDIIDLSMEKKIGMSSQMSSKVAGLIWLIVLHCGLKISTTDIESATDNTKKNTFKTFTEHIEMRVAVFKPIFERHNIPLCRV